MPASSARYPDNLRLTLGAIVASGLWPWTMGCGATAHAGKENDDGTSGYSAVSNAAGGGSGGAAGTPTAGSSAGGAANGHAGQGGRSFGGESSAGDGGSL